MRLIVLISLQLGYNLTAAWSGWGGTCVLLNAVKIETWKLAAIS